MGGWFLPKCDQSQVREAVRDMINMLKDLGARTHRIGFYRFRYTESGIYRLEANTRFIVSHRRRIGWKPIFRYVRFPETFRIRMKDLYQLADAYRELTEYYEEWKDTEAARQELDEELTEEMFEDFGPPSERLE